MKKKLIAIWKNLLVAILASIWIIPIVWLFVTSLSGYKGIYTARFFPETWTFQNYIQLFFEPDTVVNFPAWFKNSMIIGVCTCVISTAFVLMVAYAMSCMRFPSRKRLMSLSMILGMFPGFMSMIAIYHFMKAIGLDQTLLALILVYSGGAALNYYIAKGFFDTIPKTLDEAARIDGATRHTIFWKIILPNAKPIVVNTAINAFIAPWVDFIFVSVIMKDNYNNYTVAKGLYTMVDKANIFEYYTSFCAGAVLVSIPIVCLFIRLQKYYVAGVTAGAAKG